MECIPLLQKKLLDSGEPRVREMAAWWLRRRPFGYGRAAVSMRRVVMDDASPTRRARAAEALGEFLDVGGLPMLEHAANADGDAEVRLSAVRALGRLNAVGGHPAVVAAMQDDDARVRLAALDQISKLSFFTEHAAIAGALGDEDAQVRRRAAQFAGHVRGDEAVQGLIAQLQGDRDGGVRQAAAWALGRIGGSEAKAALRAAEANEGDDGVRDAIGIALRM
jgi:HEAT repeat protein